MAKQRKGQRRKLAKNIFIFCEGAKTEPQYLRGFLREQTLCGRPVQLVSSNQTAPLKLVEEAIRHRKKHGIEQDEAWVVVDKDSYTEHEAAF